MVLVPLPHRTPFYGLGASARLSMARVLPEGIPRETALVVGLISGSHVINHMYLVLFPPIMAILAAEFEVSLAALGVAMGVQAFVNTAFQLPYGYLADNYDRTLTLGLCLGLGALGTAILALAPTFEWLLVGQAILGIGIAGHHPSHYSLLADATPEAHRGRAFSVHGFAGNLGFAAPPVVIVGVMALPGLGWRHAFGLIAVVGALYGLVACVVLARRVSNDVTRPNVSERTPATADGTSESLVAGWRTRFVSGGREILETPAILALGVLAMVASTAHWGVTSYVVVLLEEGYGVASGTASLTLTAMFVTGAAFILVGGDLADRFTPGPILTGAYLLVTVFVLALASFALGPLAAVVAAVLAGSVGSLGTPAKDKLADVLSARADLGRNFAIVTIGIMVGNTIAPPLFGAIIETAGFEVAFASVGAVALLSALLTAVIVVRYRDGVTVPVGGQPGDD